MTIYFCRLIKFHDKFNYLCWNQITRKKIYIVNGTAAQTQSLWRNYFFQKHFLTHWGRVTHKCVGKLNIIGSDNGLSPGRRQVIIWTNAGILLIEPLGTTFSEILIEIHNLRSRKCIWKHRLEKRRPFCLGLNVLIFHNTSMHPYLLNLNSCS